MGTMETRIFLPGAREKLINDRSKECSGSLKRGNFKGDKANPPAPPPEATCFPLSKSDLWESMIREKRKGRKKEGKGERGLKGGKEDGGGKKMGEEGGMSFPGRGRR